MTVAELIAKLQKLEPEALIYALIPYEDDAEHYSSEIEIEASIDEEIQEDPLCYLIRGINE